MKGYQLQNTTLWDFPDRGNWATHKGDYRGNWSSHILRNLILKYTTKHDYVLDCFVGSGTTAIEAKILNRNFIGIDVNENALKISASRINFSVNNNAKINIFKGNALNMDFINSNSIDFICTHPPYADIIKYSNDIDEDLSRVNYRNFILKMEILSKELYRVLKKNCYCSFMIGDIRKNGNIILLGFLTMQQFINNGFKLKEIIIKKQNNCKSTNEWIKKGKNLNFYLLAHEYIFILYK